MASQALARASAACSTPLKNLEAEIPPEQYPGMNCDALNAENTRLLAVRDDLDATSLRCLFCERSQ